MKPTHTQTHTGQQLANEPKIIVPNNSSHKNATSRNGHFMF